MGPDSIWMPFARVLRACSLFSDWPVSFRELSMWCESLRHVPFFGFLRVQLREFANRAFAASGRVLRAAAEIGEGLSIEGRCNGGCLRRAGANAHPCS